METTTCSLFSFGLQIRFKYSNFICCPLLVLRLSFNVLRITWNELRLIGELVNRLAFGKMLMAKSERLIAGIAR